MHDLNDLAESSLLQTRNKSVFNDSLDFSQEISRLAQERSPGRGYKWLSVELVQMARRVELEQGKDALRIALRRALLHSCIRLTRSPWYAELPDRVFLNHSAALVRIAGTCESDSDWLSINSDLYLKEIGLATFRLIATGTRVFDVDSGIPRSVLFTSGLGGLLRGPYRFLRMGGFYPFGQTHVHDLMMNRITEDGRIQMWLGCAEIMRMNPGLKGMFGSSWLEDPALEHVTPNLFAYNRIPRENGAIYFCRGVDDDSISNALFKSEKRRKQYENGDYTPRRFLMIWPRQELLRWAEHWIRRNPDHPGVISDGA